MRSIRCVILAAGAVLLAFSVSAGEKESGDNMFEVRGRQLTVETTKEILARMNPFDNSWCQTFFVKAMGPLIGKFISEDKEGATWFLARCLPRESSGSGSGFRRAMIYGLMFERPFTKKWQSVDDHIVTEVTNPWYALKVEDRERICISVANMNSGMKLDAYKDPSPDPKEAFRFPPYNPYGLMGHPFCFVPLRSLVPAAEAVFVNADRIARFLQDNLIVSVVPNFSDVKDSLDLTNPPDIVTIPVQVAFAMKDFLDQRFPQKESILNSDDSKLISDFSMSRPKVQPGLAIRLSISFGIDALGMCEMIRLKATNGGFQRQGADILYRSDKPGTHTLTLEAFCGFHPDGKVDFAERRELKVEVKE